MCLALAMWGGGGFIWVAACAASVVMSASCVSCTVPPSLFVVRCRVLLPGGSLVSALRASWCTVVLAASSGTSPRINGGLVWLALMVLVSGEVSVSRSSYNPRKVGSWLMPGSNRSRYALARPLRA